MFQSRVGCQNRIVWLDNGSGDLRGRVNSEFKLSFLSIIDFEMFSKISSTKNSSVFECAEKSIIKSNSEITLFWSWFDIFVLSNDLNILKTIFERSNKSNSKKCAVWVYFIIDCIEKGQNMLYIRLRKVEIYILKTDLRVVPSKEKWNRIQYHHQKSGRPRNLGDRYNCPRVFGFCQGHCQWALCQ